MKKLAMIATILLFTTACTKNYDLTDPNAKQSYVIDARISNLHGPYFVRVTKTINSIKTDPDTARYEDRSEPVLNAQITITDDMGNIDNLQPADDNKSWYYYGFYNHKLDSAWQIRPGQYAANGGYYETTQMTGIPGHTYYLKVRIGNETFTATTSLPQAPQLDSAWFEDISTSIRMGQYIYGSFKEPKDSANYYLMQGTSIEHYPYDYCPGLYAEQEAFFYHSFDDKTLPAYVGKMQVMIVQTQKFGFGRLIGLPSIYAPCQVRLGTMTKTTFDYFTALEKQFSNDGNVYQPAPASAKGNISNGALGMFFGLSFSTKLLDYHE